MYTALEYLIFSPPTVNSTPERTLYHLKCMFLCLKFGLLLAERTATQSVGVCELDSSALLSYGHGLLPDD